MDDWNALKTLYVSTGGDNWTDNTGWEIVKGEVPAPDCNLVALYGINLDEEGRVSCLDLDGEFDCSNQTDGSNNLVGFIPAELEYLTNLTNLYLEGNQLSGSIPAELGNLVNLERLDLDHNELSGSIPAELGNLVNLEWLDLDRNQLSGNIPANLSNLKKLTYLDINHNDIGGCYPASIDAFCTQLSDPLFNGNEDISFGNSFEATWGNFCKFESGMCKVPTYCNLNDWTALKVLYESTDGDNWTNNTGWELFNGEEPPIDCDLATLYGVSLDDERRVSCIDLDGQFDCSNETGRGNNLVGFIPTELEYLANLTYLDLEGNQLSRSIPAELGNLVNLERLDLDHNQLSDSIPVELGNLVNLEWLDFCLLYTSPSPRDS